MVEKIQQTLRDSAAARWTVLVLVASMMFFAYMFVDMLSPLASLLNEHLQWDRGDFGTYAAGEYLLNVFGFLILAGIILDKMGNRFTGLLSASLMVIGAAIKYVGISDWFGANEITWLNSWWTGMPGSAKMAMFGFMIFGCGCEMAGTTGSKILAKWFKGKEMALAMGLEMSIARIGVYAAMSAAPSISAHYEGICQVSMPMFFAGILLVVGLINFFVFTIMDKKLDASAETQNAEEAEEGIRKQLSLNCEHLTMLLYLQSWSRSLSCVSPTEHMLLQLHDRGSLPDRILTVCMSVSNRYQDISNDAFRVLFF